MSPFYNLKKCLLLLENMTHSVQVIGNGCFLAPLINHRLFKSLDFRKRYVNLIVYYFDAHSNTWD
jgi:hypothetical protein